MKTKKYIILSIVFILSFSIYTNSFAISSPYNPGETLDPSCAPGSTNCTVNTSSSWSSSGSDIYFTGGNVGVGTNSPTSSLTVSGTAVYDNTELISNGSFDTDLSGWSGFGDGITDDNGTLRADGITDSYGGSYIEASTNLNLEEGETYILSFDVLSLSGIDELNVYFINNSSSLYFVEGSNSIVFKSDYTGTDTIYFSGWLSLGDSWSIDNVSIKKISVTSPLSLSNYDNSNLLSLNEDDSGNFFVGYKAGNNVSAITDSTFIGYKSGYNATEALEANFVGRLTGYEATYAAGSNFFGPYSGYQASGSNYSNFFGYYSGYQATNASESNFLGYYSGYKANNALYSNFIGVNSGYESANGSMSNFIGYNSGYQATNASNSNFIGYQAGQYASSATNSNFIGSSAGYDAINTQSSNFIGTMVGYQATNAMYSSFIGDYTGMEATNARNSVFIGSSAGSGDYGGIADGAVNAANSIFIGSLAGRKDTVNNTAAFNDVTTFANTSILIGYKTSTGGYSNSIAIGAYTTNTATNQFMIGSTTRPIDTTRWNGSASTQCTLTTGTGIACTSDERLKTNIEDLDGTILDKIINLKTVTFNWKEGNSSQKNIGFIAQDLEQYFPELVATDNDGYKSVYYANMTPVLTEAIREMNLKVEKVLNFTEDISLREKIIAWLSDSTNGITSIFSKEVHTEKICVKRSDGTERCVNGDDLDRVLGVDVTYTAPSDNSDDVSEEAETTLEPISNAEEISEVINPPVEDNQSVPQDGSNTVELTPSVPSAESEAEVIPTQ